VIGTLSTQLKAFIDYSEGSEFGSVFIGYHTDSLLG
jgi:hypothetical protein